MTFMHQLNPACLVGFAQKYIWWKSPIEAMRYPERVIAQVMNIGGYDDVQLLIKSIGEERLKKILKAAEVGQFNERSWHYWHYRLRLAKLEQVPCLPQNRFP
ncbi:MAG: hypothetical protein V4496_01465 [Pseudomonadota bacterium]